MAGNGPVDQDEIAAQWEASLDSEDPAESAAAAESVLEAVLEAEAVLAQVWAFQVTTIHVSTSPRTFSI